MTFVHADGAWNACQYSSQRQLRGIWINAELYDRNLHSLEALVTAEAEQASRDQPEFGTQFIHKVEERAEDAKSGAQSSNR